jgi:hypothetical protein
MKKPERTYGSDFFGLKSVLRKTTTLSSFRAILNQMPGRIADPTNVAILGFYINLDDNKLVRMRNHTNEIVTWDGGNRGNSTSRLLDFLGAFLNPMSRSLTDLANIIWRWGAWRAMNGHNRSEQMVIGTFLSNMCKHSPVRVFFLLGSISPNLKLGPESNPSSPKAGSPRFWLGRAVME